MLSKNMLREKIVFPQPPLEMRHGYTAQALPIRSINLGGWLKSVYTSKTKESATASDQGWGSAANVWHPLFSLHSPVADFGVQFSAT